MTILDQLAAHAKERVEQAKKKNIGGNNQTAGSFVYESHAGIRDRPKLSF